MWFPLAVSKAEDFRVVQLSWTLSWGIASTLETAEQTDVLASCGWEFTSTYQKTQ